MLISPVDLYNRLHGRPKSEFESWSAYLARVTPARGFGYYALPASCSPKFAYDAEKQEMQVEAQSILVESRGVVISCAEVNAGSYVGTNAFGVKARVTRRTGLQYVVSGVEPNGTGVSYLSGRGTWEMAPEIAAREKPYLRAVLVVRPAAVQNNELTWTDTDYDEATISSPIETTTFQRGINADQIYVWVVSGRTNQVLRKIALHNAGGPLEDAITEAAGTAIAFGHRFTRPPATARWVGDPSVTAARALACQDVRLMLQSAAMQGWTPVYFDSWPEAKKAGYDPAGDCSQRLAAQSAEPKSTPN